MMKIRGHGSTKQLSDSDCSVFDYVFDYASHALQSLSNSYYTYRSENHFFSCILSIIIFYSQHFF